MKKIAFYGKENRDYAECLTNAVSFLIAKIYK